MEIGRYYGRLELREHPNVIWASVQPHMNRILGPQDMHRLGIASPRIDKHISTSNQGKGYSIHLTTGQEEWKALSWFVLVVFVTPAPRGGHIEKVDQVPLLALGSAKAMPELRV